MTPFDVIQWIVVVVILALATLVIRGVADAFGMSRTADGKKPKFDQESPRPWKSSRPGCRCTRPAKTDGTPRPETQSQGNSNKGETTT